MFYEEMQMLQAIEIDFHKFELDSVLGMNKN